MLLILSIIGGVIAVIYVYLNWHRNHWKDVGVAGPKKNLISGSFPKSLMQKINVVTETDEIYKKYRGTTPFVGVFSSRTPQILILEPDHVRNVLVKDFKNFHDNEFADLIDKKTDPIFSRNPFMLSGEEWKEKRAEITPAFTISKLKAMFPIIDDVCKKMKLFVENELTKSPTATVCFDAKELAAKYTTDVVSSCIYGVDSKAFTDEKSIIREMGTALFEPNVIFFSYLVIISLFPFLSNIYQMPFVTKKTERFFTALMKEAIELRKKGNIERDDYLNYLLELKKKKNISDLDMAGHTITFFLDGFETSSIAISHALYLLGKNPDTQHKLRAEINEYVDEFGAITFEKINEMPYLDQVFNETLRIYPPVGVISKKCTIATEMEDFKGKKVPIEKGMIAMIPIYSIQRDPEHYAEPEKFNPDRFSAENGGLKKYRDKGVFLTFGDGPRQCLGMRFGLAQSKMAILKIVQNFRISVNPKTKEPYVIDPKAFLILPTGGLWIDLEKLAK